MFLNYFKLATRLLIRNPFFTLINVLGLSVGFAVFFTLWQYSQNELKSDTFHKDHERIVRCGYVWKWTDDNKSWSQTKFGQMWPELIEKIVPQLPEIDAYVRIFRQENFTREHIPFHGKNLSITYVNERQSVVEFKETGIVYADPNLFRFFTIPLLKGDREEALTFANSVVLSESAVKKYFGETDPIGKTLLIDKKIALNVTGVFRDHPRNSHLDFTMAISTAGIQKYISHSTFALGGAHSYFKLAEGTNITEFESKLNSLKDIWTEKVPKDQIEQVAPGLYLQPLKDVPFTNNRWDYFKTKSKFFLRSLAVISVVVLVMAWINYINLTIASNVQRMKEVGVRKTSGARARDVIKQFTFEAFLINMIACIVALTLLQLAAHPAEYFLQFYIPEWSTVSASTMLIWAGILASGILINGCIPAVVTLNRSPRSLLGKAGVEREKARFSDILITVQFSFAVVLIIWVFTIFLQLDFIMKADLGLNVKQVLLVDLPVHRQKSFEADLSVFLDKASEISDLGPGVSFSSITGDSDNNMICIKRNEASNAVCVDTNGGIDENFISFFGIKLLAGRNFLRDNPGDTTTVILSMAALQRLGIYKPGDGIGIKILVNRGTWTVQRFELAEVIGIIQDYSQNSLLVDEGKSEGHSGIILSYKNTLLKESKPQKVAIHINGLQHATTIAALEQLYKSIFPQEIFNYYFFDQQIESLYHTEKISRNQILLFTFLAIGIASIGLLGMISYKAVEKTKEIGIRKVLGAQFFQLGSVLLSTTLKQIAVAVLLGIPMARYMLQAYLQKYSQRITLEWWHYALPVVILFVIMLATVSSLLWKAVRTNPVDSLRYE